MNSEIPISSFPKNSHSEIILSENSTESLYCKVVSAAMVLSLSDVSCSTGGNMTARQALKMLKMSMDDDCEKFSC